MADVILYEKGKDPLYKTWHSQKRNMIIYVHQGEGSLVTREKSYPFKGGSLAFVGIEKYHYTMPEDTDSYKRSKLFIDSEGLFNVLKLFGDKNRAFGRFSHGAVVFAESVGEDEKKVEEIFRELSETENDDEELKDARIYSAALRLLMILLKKAGSSSRDFKGIHRAIEYINENITLPLTVGEIASASHLSKYHFCREFKKNIGMTVMDYILKTRIIMAEAMLKEEDLSVTEVAFACGFCGGSHFSKVFKETVGVTPLDYRRGRTSEKFFENK